jgi:hypothetical protein
MGIWERYGYTKVEMIEAYSFSFFLILLMKAYVISIFVQKLKYSILLRVQTYNNG